MMAGTSHGLRIFVSLLIASAATFGCTPAHAAILAPETKAPAVTASPQNTARPILPPEMPPTREWILIDLPPGASQLDYGREVYRLVCSACHGDKGQGLTDSWRATWAPEDQNCWQSKCHGSNHPPEGFTMPVAPAVVGAAPMSLFATAMDLHEYVQNYMPWYNPRSLTERDSWGVTAFLLEMNRIDPGTQLNAATAAQIRVRP